MESRSTPVGRVSIPGSEASPSVCGKQRHSDFLRQSDQELVHTGTVAPPQCLHPLSSRQRFHTRLRDPTPIVCAKTVAQWHSGTVALPQPW
jgi:hypothetical protein